MSVVDKINAMHRDAVDQIRSGESNEFLVGFLTTATLLELSNLLTADLDLEQYAQAVADVITQYAPIDRCRVQLDLPGFATIVAASGDLVQRGASTAATLSAASTAGTISLGGTASGTVIGEDVPDPLVRGNFIQVVADQVAAGLGKILDRENELRRIAVQRVVDVIERLTEEWGASDLDAICTAVCGLPTVAGITITAAAVRLGGKTTATAGNQTAHVAEREFRIDNCVECVVAVYYSVEPWSSQHGTLDELATALAMSMARAEQKLRLAQEAETDPLTGLWNRRRISKALVTARNNVSNTGGSFAVALFDLDHFKQVNDVHGHLVGDSVLSAFAGLLQRTARPIDTAARWGGEEFLLLLPGCEEREAAEIVQRIIADCPAACAHTLPHGALQTVSGGVVASVDFPRASNEGLIKEADAALYRAKRAGRNGYGTGTGGNGGAQPPG